MYALLVVGGEGQRLRPYTDDRPKAMVPVNDKPLVQYTLELLRSSGVTDVVLLCGYRADKLREHFGDGGIVGLRMQYCVEETPLGRGGAFRQGFHYVPPDEPFVVAANGDNIFSQPLAPMIAFHEQHSAAITVLLTQLRSPYGIAEVEEDGRITGFREKPLLAHWLNAGLYVISSSVFDLFPEIGDHEDTTFPMLAREGRLFGFKSRAPWRAVDTVKDLLEAGKELAEAGRA